ncbi:hypothetical protein H2198_008289 [Neophaeococcomyces mojaviensis]|uniref:Uncharacterized protein n=1 Tax=Neophaeococcomyces mojaviensis TaxID=3383035 RepID=A0ACC2ZXT0_9EURO|nr:hypothetical protein H2198_008289 [Knufia sp. JES_112]
MAAEAAPPAAPPLSQLCRFCNKINFAAILTPRERDKESGKTITIYRPEYTGNGNSPDLAWVAFGKTKPPADLDESDLEEWKYDHLPKIRTVDYDDLSISTLAEQDRAREREQECVELPPGNWKTIDDFWTAWKAVHGSESQPSFESAVPAGGKLWPLFDPSVEGGFGFLVDLSNVPDGNPLKEAGGWGVTNIQGDQTGTLTAAAEEESSEASSGESSSEDEQPRHGSQNSGRIGHAPARHVVQNDEGSDRNEIEAGTELSWPSPKEPLVQNSDSEKDKSEEDEEEPLIRGESVDDSAKDGHECENRDNYEDEDEDQDKDEEEELTDDSVSTWSGDSHFTEIQQVDLEKQARGDWNYRQGHLYYLGSIWDLRSRRHECDLCWRLWNQIRKNPDIKSQYLTKSRCVMKLMELEGRRTDGSNREVNVLNLVFVYGYKLGDPRNSTWITKISFVFHGTHRDVVDLRTQTPEDQIIPFDDRLYGEARWRTDACDYKLFREWLRVCETKHTHPPPDTKGDITVRLIDVKQKCLIEWSGPVSKAPRYVALSYIWGMSKQQSMLASYELDDCFQPGFFEGPLDQTIADAFEVVSRIGEKYLWIDACCIVQDSPEDKAIQIKQMDKVYSAAVLTIVAAYGKDADAGLPGVANKSRGGNRFQLELKDIRVLFRGTSKIYKPNEQVTDIGFMANYLENSTYLSRAWTFQEGYLSTRLLIFARDQVYFECPKCTWCEESHWESESIDFVGWRAIKDPTPDDVWSDNFERLHYDFISAEELERLKSRSRKSWNSYADLVKSYTSRKLTYDTDILNACTGVLSSIVEREKSQFVFGLRTRFFGNDLLFNILNALPPRFESQTLSAGLFPVYPSWSWTAWKGMIEIANEPRDNSSHDLVEDLVPCDGVRCYMLHIDPQGKQFLQVINENGGWRFEENYVRTGEGIYDLTDFHMSSARKDGGDDNDTAPSDMENEVGEVPSVKVDEDQEPSKASDEAKSFSSPQEVVQGTLDLTHRGHHEPILSETSVADAESSLSKPATHHLDLPSYQQTLTLSSISSHPAFSKIVPDFHIIFATFASTVVVRTELDQFNLLMSNTIMAGTKMHRAGGISSNKDLMQRKVYACRTVERKERDGKQNKTVEILHHPHHDGNVEQSSCPHCDKDTTPDLLPPGLELGAYLGRLPPLSKCWDAQEYMETVPDGIYKLLWMNNNQLPMFGHLLCKPVSEEATSDGDWNGQILQRVSGVVGPTSILDRKHQKEYAAEWGTFILG